MRNKSESMMSKSDRATVNRSCFHRIFLRQMRMCSCTIALLAISGIVLLRFRSNPLPGNSVPFVICFLALIPIACLKGGTLGGLALLLNLTAAWWLIFPLSFPSAPTNPVDVFSLLVFGLVAIVICAIGENERRAQRQAEQNHWQFEKERAQAEEDRHLLDDVLESIADGFIALDSEWHFLYVNAEAERLSGRTGQRMLGHILWEVLPDLQGTTAEKTLRHAMESRIPATAEHYFPQTDQWFSIRVHPTRNSGLVAYFREVTEAKKEEQAREQREQWFSTTLSSIGDAVLATDLEARVTFLNPIAEALTGWKREDAIGKPLDTVFVIINEKTRRRADDPVSRVLATGNVAGLANHTLLIARDGTERPIDDSAAPIRVDDRISGVVLVFRDVTERKQAERELAERETLLRTFYDTSPLFMGVTETGESDVFHIYDNPATCRFFGAEPGGTAGKWALADLGGDPDTVAVWLENYRRSERTGVPVRFEHPHFGADGMHWLAVTVAPLGQGLSGRTRFCYVGEDVTERKRAEASLRYRSEQVETLLNQAPIGVFLVDREFCVREINPVARPVFGDAPDGWVGRGIDEIIRSQWGPELGGRLIEVFRRTLETGQPFVMDEMTEVRADRGEREYYAWSLDRITLPDGEYGLVCYFRDISEQVRARQALEEHTREIEALNARLQRSMTETHHRVKNNLQLIAAMIEMEQFHNETMVPVSELMSISANVRALALIHDILTQEAKAGSDQEAVSIKVVLERLLAALRETTARDLLISRLDDIRLSGKQVTTLALVTNELISNAVKYAQGKIEIAFATAGEMAILEISDEGPGFPEGFVVATAANTGLDLVENVVRWDLRGEVAYENRSTGGARVTVRFPVVG